MPLSKLDVALMMVPAEMVAVLIGYGADQGFIWMGEEPRDPADFFFTLGRHTQYLTERAWAKRQEQECI